MLKNAQLKSQIVITPFLQFYIIFNNYSYALMQFTKRKITNNYKTIKYS